MGKHGLILQFPLEVTPITSAHVSLTKANRRPARVKQSERYDLPTGRGSGSCKTVTSPTTIHGGSVVTAVRPGVPVWPVSLWPKQLTSRFRREKPDDPVTENTLDAVLPRGQVSS